MSNDVKIKLSNLIKEEKRMFIQSKALVKINDYDNHKEFIIPQHYIGSIPEWVQNNWYFKELCKDGTISFLVDSKDSTMERVDKEVEVLKKQAEERAREQREVDSALNEAIKEAEEEAKNKGLDEISKKNLIKNKVENKIKKKK